MQIVHGSGHISAHFDLLRVNLGRSSYQSDFPENAKKNSLGLQRCRNYCPILISARLQGFCSFEEKLHEFARLIVVSAVPLAKTFFCTHLTVFASVWWFSALVLRTSLAKQNMCSCESAQVAGDCPLCQKKLQTTKKSTTGNWADILVTNEGPGLVMTKPLHTTPLNLLFTKNSIILPLNVFKKNNPISIHQHFFHFSNTSAKEPSRCAASRGAARRPRRRRRTPWRCAAAASPNRRRRAGPSSLRWGKTEKA